MAISYLGAGAVGTGTTSVTPGDIATKNTGDGFLIVVMTKPDTATINTPTGWTLIANVAGGGGTAGNLQGPTRQAWFFREKDANWSAFPTISVTSGSPSATQAYRFTKAAGQLWNIAGATGVYGTSATVTVASATMGSDPGLTSGDMVFVGYSGMTAAPTWSAQSISATGATFSAAVEVTEAMENTAGNDVGGMVFNSTVTAGTATAAPTTTATSSAANRGTIAVVRLREEAPPVSKTASESISLTVTEGTPDLVQETPVVNPYATKNSASPTTSDVIPTFTPRANSYVIVYAWTDSGTGNADISDTASGAWATAVSTGLTNSKIFCFIQEVGTSPQPISATLSYTSSVYTGYGVVDVLKDNWLYNNSRTNVQASGSPTLSGTLPATPASGDLIITFFAQNDDSASGVPIPTGFTSALYSGHSAGTFEPNRISYSTTFTSTSTSVVQDETGLASGGIITRFTPATPSTPKSGTDSAALSISETISFFKTITASDSAAISVSEGRDLNKGINNRNPNPSFETSLGSTSTANATITRVQDVTAWDGEYVAVAAIDASGGSGTLAVTESTPILPNTQYTVAIRYRLRSGTPAGTQRMAIRQYDASGSSAGSTNTSMTAPDSTWRTISSTFTTAADATDLRLGYVSTLGATSEIDIDGVQVNLGPTLLSYDPQSTTTTNVPANESNALSVSESTEQIVSASRTDTASLAVAESVAITKSFTANDSVALSVAETRSIASSLSVTDGASIGVSESTASSRTISATDTSAVGVTESTGVQADAFLPGQDTAALGVTETVTLEVFVSRVDSAAITVGDISATAVSLSTNDGAGLFVVDSSALSVLSLVSASDTATLGMSETVAISSTLSATDASAISVSETTGFTRNLAVSDSLGIALSETAANFVEAPASDTLTIAANESTAQFRTISGSDGLTIALDDVGGLFKAVTAEDTISLTITSVANNSATAPAQESVALAVTEQVSIYAATPATDSIGVGLDEQASVMVSLSVADGISVILSDTGSLFMEKLATDGATILVTEVAIDSVIGAEQASDTLGVGLSESIAIWVPANAADGGAVAVTEARQIATASSKSDTLSIVLTETRALFVEVNASDTLSVSMAESANNSETNFFAAADSGSLAVYETSSVNVLLSRHDSAVISLEEAITQFGSRPGSDALIVGLTETASVQVSIDGSSGNFSTDHGFEPVALSVTETATVMIPVEAIDTAALGVIDSGQAVGREADTVLVLVYENGQWNQGTMMVYRAGSWRVAHPHVYSDGEWYSD